MYRCNKFLLPVAFVIGIAFAAPTQAGVLSFAGNQFTTVGTTGLDSNGNINLQQNGFSTGTAFIDTPFDLQGNTPFSVFFEFSIFNVPVGPGVAGPGADGFAFVFQNDPRGAAAVGVGGGYLGYYAVLPQATGITNSVAIEFDTFTNPSWESNNNHVALSKNANLSVLATAQPSFDLNNGQRRFAWLDYDGAALAVSLATTNTKPTTALFTQAIDLEGTIGGSSAFLGFTSSTGAAASWHVIHDLDISLKNANGTVPEPSSFLAWGILIAGQFRRRRS